jgi:DNA-binding CsgD family transcriptional regulator
MNAHVIHSCGNGAEVDREQGAFVAMPAWFRIEARDDFDWRRAVPPGTVSLESDDDGLRVQSRREHAGLTPRQLQVLALLAQGKSNKLIARELGVALGTVKCHVAMILRTLEVATRTQAALMALRLGVHRGGIGPGGRDRHF